MQSSRATKDLNLPTNIIKHSRSFKNRENGRSKIFNESHHRGSQTKQSAKDACITAVISSLKSTESGLSDAENVMQMIRRGGLRGEACARKPRLALVSLVFRARLNREPNVYGSGVITERRRSANVPLASTSTRGPRRWREATRGYCS